MGQPPAHLPVIFTPWPNEHISSSPTNWRRKLTRLLANEAAAVFLVAAAERELSRLRQLQVIERVAGSWKDKDHPELKDGAANWVAKQRQLDERRLEKAAP